MIKTSKVYRDDLAKDLKEMRKDAYEKIKRIEQNSDFLPEEKIPAIKRIKDSLYQQLSYVRTTKEYKKAKSEKEGLRAKQMEVEFHKDKLEDGKKLLAEKENDLHEMEEKYGKNTQENNETEKVEESQETKETKETSKPVGFDEYAGPRAKKYRKKLETKNDIKQMEYLKSIISYNADGTINILPFKKVYCNDISGKKLEVSFVDAVKLAKSKGYDLLTVYKKDATQEEKEKSDRYKIINIFNPYGENNGDNPEAVDIFRFMTGSVNMYWPNFDQGKDKGAYIHTQGVSDLGISGGSRYGMPIISPSIAGGRYLEYGVINANGVYACGRKDM